MAAAVLAEFWNTIAGVPEGELDAMPWPPRRAPVLVNTTSMALFTPEAASVLGLVDEVDKKVDAAVKRGQKVVQKGKTALDHFHAQPLAEAKRGFGQPQPQPGAEQRKASSGELRSCNKAARKYCAC